MEAVDWKWDNYANCGRLCPPPPWTLPPSFKASDDNHPVDTRQFGPDTRHHSPALSEYQGIRANSITSGSTYQRDALRPLDSRGPQPRPSSLPWNTPLQFQPVQTSDTLSFPQIATLSWPPPHTIAPDSSYLPQSTSSVSNVPTEDRAYSAEVDRRQLSPAADQNLFNRAPFSPLSQFAQSPRAVTPSSVHLNSHIQYPGHRTVAPEHGPRYNEVANNADQLALISRMLAPGYLSARSSQPTSHNDIASRRRSRRPSHLVPRLQNGDPGAYTVEGYHRDKGKRRADYSDDSYPRPYAAADPQSTTSQPQPGSIELERAQPFEDLSTTGWAGLTEVLHPQLSLPAPTSAQAASLNHVATRTPEIISSNQTSLFSGSHDFAMNNSTIVVHPPGTGSQQSEHSAAMNWLKASMIEHAQHDSAGRDPPPRCHPETRITILERTHNWIDNPQREKRLLWIRGPAGVGKSAIVQTVADSLSVSGCLIASLFFSRPNGRSNPQRVFPTIAYQLASRHALYRAYIDEIRPPDSQPLEMRAMKEQFRLLIIEPLANRKLFDSAEDILIAIDGLDECDGDPGADDYDQNCHRRRNFQEVHREIIQLISSFVKTHPSVPVIWVIASQPESHITAVFGSNNVKGCYVEESILVDDEEACADVEKFLNSSFEKIAEAYPDHITTTPWPAYDQFLQIAKAASGLFIFGEVVIRFIDDPREENPISQLNQVLAAIAKLRQSRKNKNPLSALDVIYTAILSRIPSTRMENLKKMLPLMIYVHRKSIKVRDYNFQNMYEHFDISREDAVTSFNYLHSVIYFPRGKEIGKTQPRFYHASFRDYLEDPSRSCEYTVEKWNEGLTWPPPTAVTGDGDLSNLCKSISWVHELLTRLSSSGSTIEVLIHRYKIPDSGLLQDILDGLDFRSLLLENLNSLSFQDLHEEVASKMSCVNELERRGILRQTTLASLNRLPSDDIWTGKLNKDKDYTVFDYG
ncbi:hypothetical protein NP233_g313 [Leucocoprinus birnbaumii]|uniref:NACHT domain-containing protein n=1 Tax=Leucocoprinus birnbaumii TaxID=56174 RepID=A0AAD5YYQ4_9AGAR|nr:hypothetical protein NP233_g313 [Leucocoprinus birnbaumii]